MKIDEKLIPVGHPNRPGTKLECLKAIVIHNTANFEPTATDTGNLKYMGRPYIKKDGITYEADGVTKFRLGSAHLFIDCDSATLGIPFNEISLNCGDKPLDKNNGFNGQTFIAKNVFNYRQNNQTIAIEMCNNKDWQKVEENTIQVIKDYLFKNNLRIVFNENDILPSKLNPGEIFIFRHFSISGKNCPAPLIDRAIWNKFVGRIIS